MEKGKVKIAVGLSGGVDSAVSAYLLKKAGYAVTGVHVVCWDEGPHCKARDDRKDALAVALHLGIPFQVLDFQKEYKERVIDRFYADYEKGLTPNPDVWCNSEIKFGLFLQWVNANGFDYVATGHYAKNEGGKLMIPKDKHKDQTYFLYQLGREELERVMFPLGDLLKSEVRDIAKRAKLPVAMKKDSQGICFVGDVDINDFLRRRLKENPGDVVDIERRVIGKHKGVWFYTIGQRGGWEISPLYQKRFAGEAPVMYVVSKEVKKNQLVVGFGAETYQDDFVVRDLTAKVNGKVKVRIRHGGELLEARIKDVDGEVRVKLAEAQRGIAPGQAAVFYRDGSLLSGGVVA